ncbi:MAG: hypothetical protein HOP02_15305 [Methylococcaceae bacterium]|nr:hypothetical protein [Methylococcaceae bacterium]
MKILPALTLVSSCLALLLGAYAIFSPTNKTGMNHSAPNTELLSLQNEVAHLSAAIKALQNTQTTGTVSESLSAEVSQLKATVDALKRTQATATVALADSIVSNDPPAKMPTAAEMNAQMLEQKAAFNQYTAKVDQSFRAEMPDAKWSDDITQNVKTAFASSELSDASLIGLECRTSLCKLEVSVKDPQKTQEIQRWLAYKLGDALPKFIAVPQDASAEGQTPSTVYYLSREGHDLPKS